MGQEKLRYGYQDAVLSDLRLIYGRGKEHSLAPCQKINDPSLRIGVIGNNNLQPKRFLLSGKDRQPIVLHDPTRGNVFELRHPGKSAFLFFEQDKDRSIVSGLVKQTLARTIKRDDHLHVATVADIEMAGWQAFWAPLPERDSWEHVRLVATSTAEQGATPTEEQALALSKAFVKIA